MQQFSLDFDDAYQYVAAEKYGLTIVSFDNDFDRTERGRETSDRLKSESTQFLIVNNGIDGEHYWKIGKAGYPLSKIISKIRKVVFKLEKTYRVFVYNQVLDRFPYQYIMFKN